MFEFLLAQLPCNPPVIEARQVFTNGQLGEVERYISSQIRGEHRQVPRDRIDNILRTEGCLYQRQEFERDVYVWHWYGRSPDGKARLIEGKWSEHPSYREVFMLWKGQGF